MANRPTDWHVLDLERDPVPGDPYEVKELARKLGDFADDVSSALRSVKGLSGDSAVQDWAGLSGDAYREQFGDLPGELTKLEKSYRLASGALETYWPKLETAQADADRALAQGRTARQDLDTAKTTQSNANDWVKRTGDKSREYQADPKPGVEPPSAEEVRTATRNALDASNAQNSANSAVHDAQQRLDAAKELAAQAAHLRDTAASTAEHALHEASDAGIKNKHWWEKAVDWVADHWDDIVAVCKVIVAVLGIVVLIIGGPLAWIVLAAALVVLADTLVKYAQGKASLWDVFFAALDCIPMFKGLTTAGGLLKMAKELPALLKSGKALENIANSIRKGASGLRQTGREMKKLFTCGDPIDMATGETVMSAVDLELPGVLPLLVERHHRSSYRAGRWLGPSWASTLDQRLVIDDQGVRFTTEDGMVLHYTVPEPARSIMPVTGPRWPLEWAGGASGTMTVYQGDTGRTLHFRPLPGRSPSELPITAITDRQGNRVAVEYSAEGIPVEIRHDGGYRVGLEADQGRITGLRLLSHPEQPVLLRYDYDESGNLSGIVNSSGLPLRLTYDTRGRITSWEDRNSTWYRYEYDDLGRCVRTTGSAGILDYTYAYTVEPRTAVATNALGQSTRYEFNDSYQLVQETDPSGQVTLRTWDRFDNLLSLTDPLGRTTRNTYDLRGNLTSTTGPDGTSATYEYDESGLPSAATGPDGSRWTYAYDERGNLAVATDPAGATTTYEHDARGRLVRTIDALGNASLVENNPAGLPLAVTDASGETTRFTLDAFGRITEVAEPGVGITRIGWTPEGLPSWKAGPDGSTERWTFDAEANPVAYVDANGSAVRYETTYFDQIAAQVRPDGARIEFTYDAELRPVCVTAPDGLHWTYEYDPTGNLVQETDFNGRVLTYGYDAAGQLAERTNGAGQTVRYVRDLLGRVVEQRSEDGITVFEYDRAGGITRAANENAELLFEYDPAGRVVAETSNGQRLTNTYDLIGRRVRRRTPGGSVSAWTYDASHRPATLQSAGRVLTFAHDAVGREIERRLPSGTTLSQQWDTEHRLTTQSLQRKGASSSPNHRRYTYRSDGPVTSINDSTTGLHSYDLDTLGRVTAVRSDSRSERYAYDVAGNLVQADTGGVAGGDTEGERTFQGTLVRAAGRSSYEHDGQGRVIRHSRKLLSGGSRTWLFSWDSEDRLREVTTPDGRLWRYLYDPLGRRVAKQLLTADGSAVVEQVAFTWDGSRLAEETTTRRESGTSSTTTWDWEPGSDRPLTQIQRNSGSDGDPERIDERFYAIVTDLVGTPTELVDDDGRVVWRPLASLWGSHLAVEPGQADCPLRFPGQYYDAETGLHYNHHRYYDPETARYNSPDPLGIEPAPHHHNYVVNPLTWMDPLGLAPECKAIIRHYTTKDSYNKIMSGGSKDAITLKAGQPSKANPRGVYVSPMSPADVAKKPGGFKSYLGLTREKSEYMIEFEIEKAKFPGRLKGGRDHVWFSPTDVQIPRGSISYHGPTSGWKP